MRYYLALTLGKFINLCLKLFNRSAGGALPGLIALKIDPQFLVHSKSQFSHGVILISGTNGKTTTTSLLAKVLSDQAFKIVTNPDGSNLVRGIASTLITHLPFSNRKNYDYGVFEVDEAALVQVVNELEPEIVVLTNLFRDQLDRYGELDIIASKWKQVLSDNKAKIKLILNADDPLVASIGQTDSTHNFYYGLETLSKIQTSHHQADSIFCPKCHTQLNYTTIYYSHLGHWNCHKCGNKNPTLTLTTRQIRQITDKGLEIVTSDKQVIKTKLTGLYNCYNLFAVYLTAQVLGLKSDETIKAIESFTPIFGRQEKLTIDNKTVMILLSKNPTGFSQSIQAIVNDNPQNLLVALNDKIADGEDVSWIADIDFGNLDFTKIKNLTFSGTRAHELALRVKYELPDVGTGRDLSLPQIIHPDLKTAIHQALENTPNNETLYILPTYTAMLEIRKILTGKEIGN